MYMLKQHKTLGQHLGILNQLEMMVVIYCGGSSTSMTVAQQGTDNVSSANEQGCIAAIEAPRVGMVFGSWEEIKIYYR